LEIIKAKYIQFHLKTFKICSISFNFLSSFISYALLLHLFSFKIDLFTYCDILGHFFKILELTSFFWIILVNETSITFHEYSLTDSKLKFLSANVFFDASSNNHIWAMSLSTKFSGETHGPIIFISSRSIFSLLLICLSKS